MKLQQSLRLFFALTALILLTLGVQPSRALEDPLRIGASISFSGRYRDPAQMLLRGYTLWAEELNAEGGLLGRPVELVIRDDESKPEKTREIYQTLIEEEEVDLVLSPYGTPLTLAASEVTEQAGYVMIASAAAGSILWQRGHRYLFGLYVPADRFFIGYLDLVAREGMERVGILYEENPFNRDAAAGAARWAKRFGLDVAVHAGFQPGTSERRSLIEKLRTAGVQAGIICSYSDEGYALLEAIEKVGWQPAALSMAITPVHPAFSQRAGTQAEGIFAPSQWEPRAGIPFPGTSHFIELYKNAYGSTPSYHATTGYATGEILSQALRSLQRIDHSGMRRYIMSLDTVTVLGRFKVNEEGRQVGHNALTIQWQDGRKEIVYPPRLRTAPPRLSGTGEAE